MSDILDGASDSLEFLNSVDCYRKSKAFHKSFSDIEVALQRSEEEHETQRRSLFHLLSCSLAEESHARGKDLVDLAKRVSERLSVLDRMFRRLIILPLHELGEGEVAKIQTTKKHLETLRHPVRGSSAEGMSDNEAVLKAKQEFLEALDVAENKRRVITEENLRLFLAEELRVLKEVTQILSAEVCPNKEAEKEGVRIKCQPCADDSEKMCCVVLPAGGYEEMEELCPPGLLVKRTNKVSFVERKPAELPPFSHGPPELNEDQLKQFCDECEEHCPPSAVHCRAVCAASGCPTDAKAVAARVLGSEEGCIAKAIRQIEKARGIARMEEDEDEEEEQRDEGDEERMMSGKLHGGSGKRERVPSISIHPPEEEGQGSAEILPSAHSNVSASSVSSPAISPDSDTSPYAADGPAAQIDREGERDKTDLPESTSSNSKPGQYLTQPFPPPLLRQKARMPLPLPLSDEEEEEFLRKNEASSSNAAEGAGSATPKTTGDSESASGKGEEDTSGLGKLNGGSGKGAATATTAKSQGSEGQPSVSGASVKSVDATSHAETAASGPGPSVPEPTETPPPLDRVNEMVPEPRGPPFNDYPNQKKGAVSAPGATNPTASAASSSSSSSSDPEDRGESTMKGGHLRGGSGKAHSSSSSSSSSKSTSEGHSTQPKTVPTSHSSAVLSPVKSMIQGLTKAEEAAAEALWNMEDRVVSAVSELVETGEITSSDHDTRQERESAQQEERVKNADELTKHPWPQGSRSQRK